MAYTIQRGDTLSRIAKANNTTVDAIAKANGIKDPNKIRAGATLNIPGQSGGSSGSGGSSSGSGVSNISRTNSRGTLIKNDNYGTGAYGNKYTGSNTNTGYSNMENAPGSAGYEKGTFQVGIRNEDGDVIGYETREGILPLGTSFTSQRKIADTYTGDKETNGIFAKAKGREYGQLHHVSGYNGMGYRDAKGNYYTEDGALLREDAHFYEPGAKISPNGMYQDRGNGWERANYGMHIQFDPKTGTSSAFYVPSDSYGHYPGQRTVFSSGGDGYRGPKLGEGNSLIDSLLGKKEETQTEPEQPTIIDTVVNPDTLDDIERRRKQAERAAGY